MCDLWRGAEEKRLPVLLSVMKNTEWQGTDKKIPDMENG